MKFCGMILVGRPTSVKTFHTLALQKAGIVVISLQLFAYMCHLLITLANSLDPDQSCFIV